MLSTDSISSENRKPANPEDDFGWISTGLGFGLTNDLAYVTSLNFGRENILEIVSTGTLDFSFGDNPPRISAIGILYGYSKPSDLFRISFSAGPCYIFAKTFNNNSNKWNEFQTAGLLVKSQLIFTPVKEFGFGLDLFFNLNKENITSGLCLTLVLEGNK